MEPDGGEIWVAGVRVHDDPGKLRFRIGYMPDFFGVYEDMRVWEYLDFYARCYDVPGPRRAAMIDELLQLVALSDKRDDDVSALSRECSNVCAWRTPWYTIRRSCSWTSRHLASIHVRASR